MKVLEQIETTYKPGSSRLEPWACRCCVCGHFALQWGGQEAWKGRALPEPLECSFRAHQGVPQSGLRAFGLFLGSLWGPQGGSTWRRGSLASFWATNWLSLPKPGNSSSPPAQSLPTVVLAFSGKALSSSTWRLQSCAFPGAARAACLPSAALLIFVRFYMLPP